MSEYRFDAVIDFREIASGPVVETALVSGRFDADGDEDARARAEQLAHAAAEHICAANRFEFYQIRALELSRAPVLAAVKRLATMARLAVERY